MSRSTASELQEQQALRKRLYYAAPEIQCVAVPNAARRTQWEVMRAKKEGLATGFPDMMVIAPGGLIAFVEMKAAKGRLSEAQDEWLARLTYYGFQAAVCYGADEAVAFLKRAGFQIRERAA